GELDQRVERVRLARLPILRLALLLEVTVDDRIDRGPERLARLDRPARVQLPRTLVVDVLPQRPVTTDSLVGALGIDAHAFFGRGLAQLAQRRRRCEREHARFTVGRDCRGAYDDLGLVRGQLTLS